MKTVYLAGPIAGCSKDEANDWRNFLAMFLDDHGINAISPLRCEPLVGPVYQLQYDDHKFGTARAIGSKNMFDTARADLVLAYLPKPPEGRHQSWGTIVEIGWAHALRKPVILVTDDPEIREHPLLNYCANWILDDLEDALEVIIGLMKGY